MGYASCALCSGDVTRGDMLLRRALRFEGSVYGACCRAQIDDLVPADTKRRKPGLFVLLGVAGAVSIAAFARPGRASAPPIETPSETVAAPAENTPPRPAEQLAAEQAEAKARVVADKLASALGEDLAALLATSDAQATLGAPPLRVTRESIALLAQVPDPRGGDGSVRALVEWSLQGGRLTRRITSWAKEGEAPLAGPAPSTVVDAVRSLHVYVARTNGSYSEPDASTAKGDAFRRDAPVALDRFTLRAAPEFMDLLRVGDEVTLDLPAAGPAAGDDVEPGTALFRVRASSARGVLLDGHAPAGVETATAHAFAPPRELRVVVEAVVNGRVMVLDRTVTVR